jgi:hypothetical protein
VHLGRFRSGISISGEASYWLCTEKGNRSWFDFQQEEREEENDEKVEYKITTKFSSLRVGIILPSSASQTHAVYAFIMYYENVKAQT